MFKEFGAFIARGNVMDLAVAVIIGAAFGAIVKSLTDDMIMPVIGWLFGGLDFSSHFILLGPIPATYHGSLTSYAALKAAGVSMLGWGTFVTAAINFVILAFIIFLMVRSVNRMAVRVVTKKEATPAAEAADLVLLREIRDELRAKG